MTVRAVLRAWLFVGLMLAGSAAPAWAHRQGTGTAPPDGAIVIPNLSHGQMRVIADNGAAIMDLAARQIPTDPILRRLEGFVNLQRFACFWGIVPGSVQDESSPFNECTHAYLAAMRALLLHLQETPGDQSRVRALAAKIQSEMTAHQASLILCRYSDEPFNTAEIIGPHWSGIPAHAPTSMMVGGLLVMTMGGIWLTLRGGSWQEGSATGAGRRSQT